MPPAMPDIALPMPKESAEPGRRVETSFKEETETDLFGEQVVLCGESPLYLWRGLKPRRSGILA